MNLSGNWVLDPAHSTDSRAALAALDRAGHKHARYGGSDSGSEGGPGRGVRDSADAEIALPQAPFVPDLSLQSTALSGGGWLKITQTPAEMIIANDRATASYTPGEKSVVSVSTGVADQASGWKGKDYVVQIRPQVGPGITERFRLSADGKQLVETIEIGRDAPIPSVKVTRTYQPSPQVPTELPGN